MGKQEEKDPKQTTPQGVANLKDAIVRTNRKNGANLGFEEKPWKAAHKLRKNNMDAAEFILQLLKSTSI
jgi:hypothetical protein